MNYSNQIYCDKCNRLIDTQWIPFQYKQYNLCLDCTLELYQKIFNDNGERFTWEK